MNPFKRTIIHLEQQQRFHKVHSQKVNKEVLEYLKNKFQNLKIEICGDQEGNMIELMKKGLLEGWCWQTTETAILFLKDDDYIERGVLKLNSYRNYPHSWICFQYQNIEYVFDPCLDILCTKDFYHQVFEIEVKGRVTSKQVQEDLLEHIERLEKIEYKIYKKSEAFLLFDKYGNGFTNEIYISGDDNINSPMYRNKTGYTAEIEQGKVKKLTAHYY